MGIIAVFVSVLAMGVVFGFSAFIFVPMLENLDSEFAGGLSNLWIWGTSIVAAVVFFIVFRVLIKCFSAVAEKIEQKRKGKEKMKRGFVSSVLLLVLLFGITTNSPAEFYTKLGLGKEVASAVDKDIQTRQDFKYGMEGQIALQTDGADIIQNGNSIVLSGGPDPSGVASVFFLFRADRNAERFRIILDYHGDGQVEVLDFSLSTDDNPRPYVFPVNGKDNNDGRRVISFSDPMTRVIDKNGDIEIHVSVGPGKFLTLNSISVEYIYQQSNQIDEVRVVRRYYGVLPPGYGYSALSYYHRGPVWVWVGGGYEIYDGWWYSPSYTEWVRVYYPTPIYRYYYHYCGGPYIAEKHIYVHHSGGNRIRDHRRDSVDRAPERIPEQRVRSATSSLQNSSDRKPAPTSSTAAVSGVTSIAEAKGAKRLSREAMTGLMQQRGSREGQNRAPGSVQLAPTNVVQSRGETQSQVHTKTRRSATESRQPSRVTETSGSGSGFLDRIVRKAQSGAQSFQGWVDTRTSTSSGGSAGGENVLKRRAPIERSSSTSQAQAQLAPSQNQQEPAKQRREAAVRTSESPQPQPVPSTTSSSSNSDDDEHKKTRRGR